MKKIVTKHLCDWKFVWIVCVTEIKFNILFLEDLKIFHFWFRILSLHECSSNHGGRSSVLRSTKKFSNRISLSKSSDEHDQQKCNRRQYSQCIFIDTRRDIDVIELQVVIWVRRRVIARWVYKRKRWAKRGGNVNRLFQVPTTLNLISMQAQNTKHNGDRLSIFFLPIFNVIDPFDDRDHWFSMFFVAVHRCIKLNVRKKSLPFLI